MEGPGVTAPESDVCPHAHPKRNFCCRVIGYGTCDDNLVIIYWFYVKKCIFEHYNRENFSGDPPLRTSLLPQWPQGGGVRTVPPPKLYYFLY